MKIIDVCGFHTMLHFLVKILFLTLLILIYCEFIIYYFVLLGCSWPQLSKLEQDFTIQPPKDSTKKPLRVMFIADTHLICSYKEHSFNKLRREWQMYRSFQSAQFLFEPHIVFFLGDVTDGGQLCSDDEWHKTVERFYSLFSTSNDTRIYVLPGNHDIGFHYEVTDGHLKRFEHSFQAPHVRLLTIDDDKIHFILINSIAFEGDQCRLCQRAENELNEVVNDLKRTGAWTKPILLSHFPLYRMNDEHCSRSSSTSSLKTTSQFPLLRERFDVLSQEATEHLLTTIQPRLAFSAHMHNYCYIQHNHTNNKLIPEWTIPSFSWEIRDDPSFMLMTITTNNQRVAHCSLPRETTVFWSYVIGAFLIIFYILFGGRRPYCLIVFCFLRKILKI
ncbi:unnamed protein product [Adineta steineri]|uniref:Calcineurin-like phosphoesterase domain-containing protein n=1 Tax=Adineta steineri TaxID=433720 RepID=A0A814C8G9_9BILA|nr:unnamed protein product [Adineta steineri]CAF3611187.1 unnamed protein product [Adineta steineri]CAF3744218.1 unnamed protein product [Adineta steineri]